MTAQQRTHTRMLTWIRQHASYHNGAILINCMGHFNCPGHFVHLDDFGCNVNQFN